MYFIKKDYFNAKIHLNRRPFLQFCFSNRRFWQKLICFEWWLMIRLIWRRESWLVTLSAVNDSWVMTRDSWLNPNGVINSHTLVLRVMRNTSECNSLSFGKWKCFLFTTTSLPWTLSQFKNVFFLFCVNSFKNFKKLVSSSLWRKKTKWWRNSWFVNWSSFGKWWQLWIGEIESEWS